MKENKEYVIYIEIDDSLRATAQNVSLSRNLSDIVREGIVFAKLKQTLNKTNKAFLQTIDGFNKIEVLRDDAFINSINIEKNTKRKMIRIPQRYISLVQSLSIEEIKHGVICVTKIMILRNKLIKNLESNNYIEFVKNLLKIIFIYTLY